MNKRIKRITRKSYQVGAGGGGTPIMVLAGEGEYSLSLDLTGVTPSQLARTRTGYPFPLPSKKGPETGVPSLSPKGPGTRDQGPVSLVPLFTGKDRQTN